jgi:hypothetical protein
MTMTGDAAAATAAVLERREAGWRRKEGGRRCHGAHTSGIGEKRGSRGNLDYTKIRRPASRPKSIKYVQNGTSQGKSEL